MSSDKHPAENTEPTRDQAAEERPEDGPVGSETPTCAECGGVIGPDDIICPHCGVSLVAG